MAVTPEYRAFIIEQLERCTPINDRRMFGGVGLYAGDVFFALIDDNTLYFKVDDENLPDYQEAGMEPFRPYGPDGPAAKYFQVPASVLEDDGQLCVWVQRAVEVALRAKKRKKK